MNIDWFTEKTELFPWRTVSLKSTQVLSRWNKISWFSVSKAPHKSIKGQWWCFQKMVNSVQSIKTRLKFSNILFSDMKSIWVKVTFLRYLRQQLRSGYKIIKKDISKLGFLNWPNHGIFTNRLNHKIWKGTNYSAHKNNLCMEVCTFYFFTTWNHGRFNVFLY